MKITKLQLRRIIKEEKRKLLKEQPYIPDGSQGVPGISVFRVDMLVAVRDGAEEYILSSIEDGMEFDADGGEGIIEYSVQKEESSILRSEGRIK